MCFSGWERERETLHLPPRPPRAAGQRPGPLRGAPETAGLRATELSSRRARGRRRGRARAAGSRPRAPTPVRLARPPPPAPSPRPQPAARPSPTAGRRLGPRPGPAHPGSGSAAAKGPPARGTFSSRPTTGVGGSRPATWLCGPGKEGRHQRGGGEGAAARISPRAAPVPSARRPSRRSQSERGVAPRARLHPGRSSPHSLLLRLPRASRSAPAPALGPSTGRRGRRGAGGRAPPSALATHSLPSLSRETTAPRGPRPVCAAAALTPEKWAQVPLSQVLRSLGIHEEKRARRRWDLESLAL